MPLLPEEKVAERGGSEWPRVCCFVCESSLKEKFARKNLAKLVKKYRNILEKKVVCCGTFYHVYCSYVSLSNYLFGQLIYILDYVGMKTYLLLQDV